MFCKDPFLQRMSEAKGHFWVRCWALESLEEMGMRGNVTWQTSVTNHILASQAVLGILPPFKLQPKATVVLLVCGQRKSFEQGKASVHKP